MLCFPPSRALVFGERSCINGINGLACTVAALRLRPGCVRHCLPVTGLLAATSCKIHLKTQHSKSKA